MNIWVIELGFQCCDQEVEYLQDNEGTVTCPRCQKYYAYKVTLSTEEVQPE